MERARALDCKVVTVPQVAEGLDAANERELLAAMARGERMAADALVERTYRKVFGLLYRLCGDRELAADLTQESYRRAWQSLGEFRQQAQFSTWMYRIATNVYLNFVRRPRLVEPMEEEFAIHLMDDQPGPDQEAERAEMQRRLRRVVVGLPDDLRFVVVARFWGEVPVSEIAAAEGVSEVAIRKRLRRAVSLLSVSLQGVEP